MIRLYHAIGHDLTEIFLKELFDMSGIFVVTFSIMAKLFHLIGLARGAGTHDGFFVFWQLQVLGPQNPRRPQDIHDQTRTLTNPTKRNPMRGKGCIIRFSCIKFLQRNILRRASKFLEL